MSLAAISKLFDEIDVHVQNNAATLKLALTELHSLLNKCDPQIVNRERPPYSLVKEGFRAGIVLKNIRKLSQLPMLTLPQIRFKADALSRMKHIPLPSSTRKHKEPLMQWFDTHWGELSSEISKWKEESTQEICLPFPA
jgi:hypothetical protein